MTDYTNLFQLKHYFRIYPPAPALPPKIRQMIDLNLLDLYKANAFNPNLITEKLYWNHPDKDKVFKNGDLNRLTTYLWDYKPCAVFEYLTDVLKQHGFTDNSPIHPCLEQAIEECVSSRCNNFRDPDDFFDALDYYVCKNPKTALLPEDFWLNDLNEALYYIKHHTDGFYPDKSPGLTQTQKQKDKALSLSSLAQEARSASDALSRDSSKRQERSPLER